MGHQPPLPPASYAYGKYISLLHFDEYVYAKNFWISRIIDFKYSSNHSLRITDSSRVEYAIEVEYPNNSLHYTKIAASLNWLVFERLLNAVCMTQLAKLCNPLQWVREVATVASNHISHNRHLHPMDPQYLCQTCKYIHA